MQVRFNCACREEDCNERDRVREVAKLNQASVKVGERRGEDGGLEGEEAGENSSQS